MYTDYDRISDTLLYITDTVTLDFVTVLSAKDKNGNRSFFHSEYSYDSSKYRDSDQGKTIKRRMNFYFVFSDKNSFERSFMVRPQDAQLLKMVIEQQILPWYFNSSRIFKIIDNSLRIVGNFNEVVFSRNEYQYLKFVPCIYTFDDGTFKEGIRMYMSSDVYYVDMEIDKFMGIYYLLANTDMYGVACSMSTYVKTGPYDVNVWSRGSGLGGAYNPPEDIWNNNAVKKSNTFFSDKKKKNG